MNAGPDNSSKNRQLLDFLTLQNELKAQDRG